MPKKDDGKPKPKHAKGKRGATRSEKATAKAKETGQRAKFRFSALRAMHDFQAGQDADKDNR